METVLLSNRYIADLKSGLIIFIIKFEIECNAGLFPPRPFVHVCLVAAE